MFRRFHHGHSAALGFLLALAMERHTLTLVFIALLVGLVTGRAWATWALWASALREKWHLSKRETINTTPVPVYLTRPSAKRKASQTDEIPF